MPSLIDITKPATGQATTQSVRDNFAAAKTEIENLQLGNLKIPFSFGDATPKVLLANTAPRTILQVSIVLETAFNGVGASLSVGTSAQPDLLLAGLQNSPEVLAEFTTNPNKVLAEDILLTIVPGSAASSGSGFVILNIV